MNIGAKIRLLRKEEADGETKSRLDAQAKELIALFKAYPAYRESAEAAEKSR